MESYFEGETPLQVSDDKMLKDVMGISCKPGENIDSSGKCIVGMFSHAFYPLVLYTLQLCCILLSDCEKAMNRN